MMTLPPPLLTFAAVTPMQDSWSIVFPVILAMLAIYLLLPRPRSLPRIWGAAAAALALLLAGGFLIARQAASAETVLFCAFSGIAIVAGGLMITLRDPVRAALCFALVVLSTCGLFLLQAAPFLMAATIIIYAGAIIVTFMFVIMLAQQGGQSDADHRSREPFLACVAGFVLLGALLAVLRNTYNTRELDAVLELTASAAKQPSYVQIKAVLAEDKGAQETTSREAVQLRDALNELVSGWEPTGDVEKLKDTLSKLHEHGLQVRKGYGSLQVPAGLPISSFSRPDSEQQGKPALPAENVAYLGRALFTDYLLAVELGGTLLLVATIGTIAITARRPEGVA